jgi:hypothetical protein
MGRRGRRLEASDKVLGTPVAGSFRNGDFSSIETGFYKPTTWIEKLNQHANEIDRAYWSREKRKWPLDVMGAHRHESKSPKLTIDRKLRQTILDTEQLLKDEPSNGAQLGDEQLSRTGASVQRRRVANKAAYSKQLQIGGPR